MVATLPSTDTLLIPPPTLVIVKVLLIPLIPVTPLIRTVVPVGRLWGLWVEMKADVADVAVARLRSPPTVAAKVLPLRLARVVPFENRMFPNVPPLPLSVPL